MTVKKAVIRAVVGFAAGVLAGYITMIIVSLFVGEGNYIAVLPRFARLWGSEMKAVLVQTTLSGLVGVSYALSSFFFENRWSLLAQFAAYFAVTFPTLVTVVLICWTPENSTGLIINLCTLPIGYIITFFKRLELAKKDVAKINDKIESYNEKLEREEEK